MNLPTCFIKKCKESLIFLKFNKSFKESIFPDKWKTAFINLKAKLKLITLDPSLNYKFLYAIKKYYP